MANSWARKKKVLLKYFYPWIGEALYLSSVITLAWNRLV